MPLIFTIPLQEAMTPELRRRIERAYRKFPELTDRRVVVGITKRRGLDGYAVGGDYCIRLYVTRRTTPSLFTIGHELTHLLQKPGLGLIPNGEVQCDIWTLARSDLFLDERPNYLRLSDYTQEEWPFHARRVRELCQQAIEVRRTNRNYIVWLKDMLRQNLRGSHSA
jgi:hypothetical protein